MGDEGVIKEARLLLDKAVVSLIISIEHFNRPSDKGRVTTVLILLDHAFEMLLKSCILQKGGKIREKRAPQTIGFDACVRRALSDGKIKFLTEEQVLQLQSINNLRDAAQHHLLDISEQHFYIHIQGGLTLFADILRNVSGKDLKTELPERVLPISTTPPIDLISIFKDDVEEIRKLLKAGKRRKVEATAKLRSLAIVEGAVIGERLQPGKGELAKLASEIAKGKKWEDIFPGVSSINLSSSGSGPSIDLRFSKKEGIPIRVVPEGTEGATVVGIKRVNELDYYTLGHKQLTKKVGLSGPKVTAIIWHLKLKKNVEYFKEITIDASKFGRYSQKAIDAITDALKTIDIDEVWRSYSTRNKSDKTK